MIGLVGAPVGFGVSGAVPLEWIEAFAYTYSNGVGYLTGWTVRHTISAANLSTSGEAVRITVRAGSSGMTVNPCYIGKASVSGQYNFDSTPNQVFFSGGSASVTIGANGTALSDEIPMALDSSERLVISWYISAGTGRDLAVGGGIDTVYAGGNSAANLTASVTGGGGGWRRGIQKIEVLTTPP